MRNVQVSRRACFSEAYIDTMTALWGPVPAVRTVLVVMSVLWRAAAQRLHFV